MARDEEVLEADNPADVSFWNRQLDKVLKSLKQGLESAVVEAQGPQRDWERPEKHVKALQIALRRKHDCPYCSENADEFSSIMLHVLENHLFYGQDLISTLKNGQNIKRIR